MPPLTIGETVRQGGANGNRLDPRSEPAAGKTTTGAMVYGSLFSACSCHARGMLTACLSRARAMLEACSQGPKKGDSVRTERRQPPSMTKPKSLLASRLRKAGPPGRSNLFYWLYDQYDAVADRLNGPRPNWVEVAASAEAAGILGTNGKPQSAHAMREMWLRVRRVVEREKTEQMERRLAKKAPDRSPRRSAGRHEVTPAPHRVLAPSRPLEQAHHPPPIAAVSVPAARGGPVPARPAQHAIEELTPEAQAQIDKVRKGLTDWDRRRHGT